MIARSTRRALLLAALVAAPPAWSQKVTDWPVHSTERPQPPVVTPAGAVTTPPPSDAVVLFDGRDFSKWRHEDGSPARWKVANGYVEVAPGSGSVRTAQGFGDCQLHIEFMAPVPARGEGQERGNSGVFLMGRYEVQVLDSYKNTTYPDGQAAAVYGQHPPLVNAARPPGEWQSYDIVFRRPRFDAQGKLLRPARVTVFHNGVLVQDAVELTGPTGHKSRPPYEAHPDALPLGLQDHGNTTRFRNIWIRPLADSR
jgi:hypothetical protein